MMDLVLCDRPVRGSTTKQRLKILLQLSYRNPLLQELLQSGTHYQTPSLHWLRYHPSEDICLLHHARWRAHSIAEISVRRLAIIIQIQIQTVLTVAPMLQFVVCRRLSVRNVLCLNGAS